MKTIIAMLLTVTTLAAWAGNEGPSAMPPRPQTIIAQVVSGGGFAPPSVPVRWTVDIMSNGDVQATESYRDGHTDVKLLAVLSADVLANLKVLVQSTKAGELVDPNPSQPGCMDAPSTTYYSILNDGTKIAIAGSERCKELERKDATGSDYTIKNVLAGLTALDSLKSLPKHVLYSK